jgi:hypothetical protein
MLIRGFRDPASQQDRTLPAGHLNAGLHAIFNIFSDKNGGVKLYSCTADRDEINTFDETIIVV